MSARAWLMQHCKNFVVKSSYFVQDVDLSQRIVLVLFCQRQQVRGLHSGGPHLYTTGTGEWPLSRCGWLRILWRWEPVKWSDICVEFVEYYSQFFESNARTVATRSGINNCSSWQRSWWIAIMLGRIGSFDRFQDVHQLWRCVNMFRLEVDDANNFRRIGEPTEVQKCPGNVQKLRLRWKHGMDLQDWWIGNSLSVRHT